LPSFTLAGNFASVASSEKLTKTNMPVFIINPAKCKYGFVACFKQFKFAVAQSIGFIPRWARFLYSGIK
jgi:hypothetical protein